MLRMKKSNKNFLEFYHTQILTQKVGGVAKQAWSGRKEMR